MKIWLFKEVPLIPWRELGRFAAKAQLDPELDIVSVEDKRLSFLSFPPATK